MSLINSYINCNEFAGGNNSCWIALACIVADIGSRISSNFECVNY